MVIAGVGAAVAAKRASVNPGDRKMLIIGLDGLDPALVDKYMAEGLLPNLKRLTADGTLSRLATSNPPQSPVAWSCLISGGNPGHHDVFDFIVRDPHTHLPEMGMTEARKSAGVLKEVFAGLTGPAVQNRRKGEAFWDVLGKNKIKSVVLRMPVTFPAEPMEGRLLSGMGTPDIRGTQGISTFFTTSEAVAAEESRGRLVLVSWNGSEIDTELTGPRIQGITGRKDATTPLRIERRSAESVILTAGGESVEIRIGQWSPWMRVSFSAGLLSEIKGVCRFHLRAIGPELELYATPINIDPQDPAMPISHPTGYAKEIFDKIGNYYTQGMPYDTWALNEGRLSEEEFLEQAYSILEENRAMMNLELDRFDRGLMFCYFGITDLVQHMFWRYTDPGHPSAATSTNPAVRDAIREVYRRIDGVVGEAADKAGKDTAILVISDHGFGSFRRAAHVNSWLRDNGFLEIGDGSREGKEFFANVSWENTRAYSVGFGGIYVNQYGRERDGSVYKGAETDQLVEEIAAGLMAWKDNGQSVVKRVYRRKDLYSGPYADNGPDLFIGFNAGYRASWQSGLGAAPEPLVEDNTRMWSGDHLCEPTLVPGVLATNLKLNPADAGLTDIAPTVLKYFGIPEQPGIEGKPLN